MVIFSYLNFHEAREERVKAGVALTTANDAATKASAAVMRADDAAIRVSRAEASVSGTVARVREIEQSSVDMNNRTKQIQIKTNSGLKTIEANLKDIEGDAATLAIYYNAKGGDRSAYNALTRLSKQGDSRKGMLAKSLLNDVNLYFQDYKYSFVTQKVMNKNTKQYYRPSAETMHVGIYSHADSAMREAYINEIGQRDLKYFGQDLVKISREDSNLKVACRAGKAIESLTGERFEDYPPYNKVQLWWDQKGNKDKKYSHSMRRLSEMPAKFGEKEFDDVIALLNSVIDSQQGMCNSHSSLAEIYLIKGDKVKAKEHYKIAIDQCDDTYRAKIRYASFLYQEGKKNETFEMLSKTKRYVNDAAVFEDECRSLIQGIEKEEGFKKIFNDK
jgi:hypothetical protein